LVGEPRGISGISDGVFVKKYASCSSICMTHIDVQDGYG
jgi:hypothetical protein